MAQIVYWLQKEELAMTVSRISIGLVSIVLDIAVAGEVDVSR